MGFAALADHHRAEILRVIDAPHGTAVGGVQAAQFAVTGLGIDAAIIHERRAARAGRALVVREHGVNIRAPKFLAIGFGDSVERFLIGLVIEIENLAAGDDGRSEALADFDVPENFWLDRESGRDRNAIGNMTGAIRAAPLRPIGGRRGKR